MKINQINFLYIESIMAIHYMVIVYKMKYKDDASLEGIGLKNLFKFHTLIRTWNWNENKILPDLERTTNIWIRKYILGIAWRKEQRISRKLSWTWSFFFSSVVSFFKYKIIRSDWMVLNGYNLINWEPFLSQDIWLLNKVNLRVNFISSFENNLFIFEPHYFSFWNLYFWKGIVSSMLSVLGWMMTRL